MYKPIEYLPQVSNPWLHAQPAPEPEPELEPFGLWTTIALAICRVIGIPAFASMMYLVWIVIQNVGR